MNSHFRVVALTCLAALVSACSSTSDREHEACIAGFSGVGGALGAVAGGMGAVGGVALGAGVSSMLCDPADSAAEPMMTAAATAPSDSDGDGVMNADDQCPGTPAGAAVDMRGCALDSDGDGVADYRDRCANTPAGVNVDRNGCPIKDEIVMTVERLGFEFDSAELDAQSKRALDATVDVIKSHSEVQMDIVGYTDSKGSEEYNQGLSVRRAQAAKDYLVSQGVSASQLNVVGRGESSPVASNDSDDGRARNRRVELVVR